MRLLNLMSFLIGMGLLVYAAVTYTKVTQELQGAVAEMVETQMTSVVPTEAEIEPDPSEDLPRVFNDRGNELSPKEVRAMLSTEPVRGGSQIYLRERFDMRELMQDGEEMPQGNLSDLMAEVRSTNRVRARCGDIEHVFSGGCLYASHDVKRSADPKFEYISNTRYFVAFEDGIGLVPEGEAFALMKEGLRSYFPYNPGRPDVILLPTYETALRRALSYLQDACDTVRSSIGNCFIASASIEPQRKDRRRTTPALTAGVKLEYLMPIELAELQ